MSQWESVQWSVREDGFRHGRPGCGLLQGGHHRQAGGVLLLVGTPNHTCGDQLIILHAGVQGYSSARRPTLC